MSYAEASTVLNADNTLATVEDAQGARITSPVLTQLLRAVPLTAASKPALFEYDEVEVVPDGNRAFVLIRRATPGLAVVDRAQGRVLFNVPIQLSGLDPLEVSLGVPLVRTRHFSARHAALYDPTNGQVLYHDERPAH